MARSEPIMSRYVYVPHAGKEYRIFYEEAGQGIPLVCLHTAGTDSREWRHQLCDPDINKDFRVIAFDLPRHGKSIPPAEWWKEAYKLTANFYAEFTMAFCKELGLEKPNYGEFDGRQHLSPLRPPFCRPAPGAYRDTVKVRLACSKGISGFTVLTMTFVRCASRFRARCPSTS